MNIEYKKSAVKYINKCNIDTKQRLKSAIETISRVVVRFIPEDIASDDEIETIARAKADNEETISHEAINWA